MALSLLGRNKIGLVLGSGVARGLAHVGAVKALQEQKFHIDLIAGSSIGALVGACYAHKGDIRGFEKIVLETDFKRFWGLVDVNPVLISQGLVQGNKVKELLRPLLGGITFKDLQIPLAVVSTDVYTGEEIVLREGSVLDAVRASISIPAIFAPVKLGNRFLIDGGVVNPLPVNVARSMGARTIIACNVIYEPGRGRQHQRSGKGRQTSGSIETKAPNVFDVVMQAIYTASYKIIQPQLKEARIVVTPDTSHIELLEFYRGKELIQLGYQAMKQELSRLRRIT